MTSNFWAGFRNPICAVGMPPPATVSTAAAKRRIRSFSLRNIETSRSPESLAPSSRATASLSLSRALIASGRAGSRAGFFSATGSVSFGTAPIPVSGFTRSPFPPARKQKIDPNAQRRQDQRSHRRRAPLSPPLPAQLPLIPVFDFLIVHSDLPRARPIPFIPNILSVHTFHDRIYFPFWQLPPRNGDKNQPGQFSFLAERKKIL